MPGRFMRQKTKPKQPASDPFALAGTSDAGALPPSGGIPHLAGPTDPAATDDMAAGGLPVVRGNSRQQPMTPQGHARISAVGRQLASKGGATEIVPGTSQRAQETAQELNAAGAGPLGAPQPGLESHSLGNLEGAPKTPDVKALLRTLVKKYPTERLPGRGAMSGRPAESEREFEVRTGQAFLGLMQRLASNPQNVILVPTSTQVIKFGKAWVAKGMPDDFSIAHESILKDDGGGPGQIERFFPTENGPWEFTLYKPDSADLPPGIYFIRHGETASTANPNPTDGQKEKALLVQAVTNRDWKGAQEIAKRASKSQALTDSDIEQAIDESLPDPQTAQNLMPHDLLSIVSAAGPAKRAQLAPVLQGMMGNLSQLSPGAQQVLKSHLGRLGVNA